MTQDYIGTKQITAWEQDKDGKPGYAVKYADGYVSWSPQEVFEAAYLPLGHIGDLAPHQQRVVGECAQLRDKLTKLTGFIGTVGFLSLPAGEQDRMLRQSIAMREYATVLDERVSAFGEG